MVPQLTKEKHEEESKLNYIPMFTHALSEAEQNAFNVLTDIWRNVFEGKVRNSRIGELVSDYRNFEGASIRYARMADEEIYSAEITFNRQKAIVTARVSDRLIELMRTDLHGNDAEYLTCDGKEIIRRA